MLSDLQHQPDVVVLHLCSWEQQRSRWGVWLLDLAVAVAQGYAAASRLTSRQLMMSGSSPSKRTSTTGPMTCDVSTPVSVRGAGTPDLAPYCMFGPPVLACSPATPPGYCAAPCSISVLRSPGQHSQCPRRQRVRPQRQSCVCLLCAQTAARCSGVQQQTASCCQITAVVGCETACGQSVGYGNDL